MAHLTQKSDLSGTDVHALCSIVGPIVARVKNLTQPQWVLSNKIFLSKDVSIFSTFGERALLSKGERSVNAFATKKK